MNRLHVHVGVADLSASVEFYSGLFGVSPDTLETDYAKWMLDDPLLNFAISTRCGKLGIDHLGIQCLKVGGLNPPPATNIFTIYQ
jgi:catechol 2,3-dioxygenase-like lactoylglutathione lyase family enzyme